jgi:hypothetical protein
MGKYTTVLVLRHTVLYLPYVRIKSMLLIFYGKYRRYLKYKYAENVQTVHTVGAPSKKDATIAIFYTYNGLMIKNAQLSAMGANR